MPAPTCPACAKAIEWRHSFTFWNPWNYPCPHCGAALEACKVQKGIAFAVIPGGALMAVGALALQRVGFWSNAIGILYILVVVTLLIVGIRVSWSHTRFALRDRIP